MSDTPNPYADTKDMYTVHTMFRREYALLPGLVRTVAAKDQERARVVAHHVKLVNQILFHHHSSEDAALWPVLLKRAPREVDSVVQLLESQHGYLEILLDEVDVRLDAWTADAGTAEGEALETTLHRLAAALYEHMGLEEKLALPLIERHVFASEWEAMVTDGAAGIPPEIGPLMVGMLMYEGELEIVPPEMREVLAEIAPKAYAAHCEHVHGTPTPPRSSEVGLGTPHAGIITGAGWE